MTEPLSDLAEAPGGLWQVNNPTGTAGLIGVDKVGDAVRFFDPEDLREIAVLDLKNHHEVAITPDHRLAYVGEFGKFQAGRFVQSGEAISVVDLERQAVCDRIATAPCKGPHGMRFDGDGGLWVIFEETGELARIDLATRELSDVFDIGAAGRRPPFIEITPDGRKIYVSSKLGDLLVFDVASRSVVAEIAVPSGTEGIAASPLGGWIVVAENSEQRLLVIDTASDRIVDRIGLIGAVLSNPAISRLIRLRFSCDGRFLVSTNYASGVIHIHDGRNPSDHVMLAVAKGPQGIAFKADNRHAVIANHDSSSMTLVDLEEARCIDWRKAGKGLETLTFY